MDFVESKNKVVNPLSRELCKEFPDFFVRRSVRMYRRERKVVRPRRFELLTYSFGGCRSIQLSYGRASLG
jgi:hypothetical protein